MPFPHPNRLKAFHPNTSKIPPLSLWLLTEGERSWSESTVETQRLARDPRRKPEGVEANVKTELAKSLWTAQKTCLHPQSERIRYPVAAVRVGQGMVRLALDPLLDPVQDVGEQRVV